MDASKEGLIRRLLNEGKITKDEAFLLRKKELENIEYIPQQPISPFPQIKKYVDPNQEWIEKELDNRQRIAENCGCNPANGGNGICGCVLTSPFIY